MGILKNEEQEELEDYISIRYNDLELMTAYNEDLKTEDGKPDIVRILMFKVRDEFVIHVPEYEFLDYQDKVFESKVNYHDRKTGSYAGVDWCTLEEGDYEKMGEEEIEVDFDAESDNEDDWKYIYKTVTSYLVFTLDVGFEHG
jgi:hypothetical protein